MGSTTTMREILVAGGGPAGAAAAIAARMRDCRVRLLDRATTARHKVCGEFISPGASEILQALGAWDEFRVPGPRPIQRCALHLGNRTKHWRLPECGWGLSRLELDRLLLDKAAALGAIVSRGETFDADGAHGSGPSILACGRRPSAEKGDRLFGFKAHFEGPTDDAVELFFDAHGYAGVSGIENNLTNVCGIATESSLQKYGFDFDQMVSRPGPLGERVRPLRRRMAWIAVGPVSFAMPSTPSSRPDVYAAGDALGFVDPFTGSGILNALLTGRLAGLAAARGIPASEYLLACRGLLGRPFAISSILRRLADRPELHWLARYVPGRLLFRLTRASAAAHRAQTLHRRW